MGAGFQRPSLGHCALRTFVVVLVFTGARHQLFTSPILVANKSLRIFNIPKMATERSQRAMLKGQYWVFNAGDNPAMDSHPIHRCFMLQIPEIQNVSAGLMGHLACM